MRLTTKARYGSRAMLDLALNYGEGPVVLKDVAQRQDVSEGYLENIMAVLAAEGLVESVRGKRGGFMLAQHPEKILLGSVVRAAEGSVAPVSCVDDPEECDRAGYCVTRDIWSELKDVTQRYLDSITLQDMVEMHHKKVAKRARRSKGHA